MNTLSVQLVSAAATTWLLVKAYSEFVRTRVKHGFTLTKGIEQGEQITLTANLYEGETQEQMTARLQPLFAMAQKRKDDFWEMAQEHMKKMEEEQKAAAVQKKAEKGSHLTPA